MTATPTFAARLRGLPDPETSPECYDGVALKRAIAWLVDVTVIAVICALLVPLTAFVGLFFFPLMMMVVGFVYRVATIASGSATWGMRLMAIELRDGDDRPLDTSQAFLHTAGYAVSMMVFPLQLVSMAMMLLTPHGQGLTDSVLATTALRRRR
ncbi:MAG: RDD family protein [Limimaricola soesokkakensis]|uniref:RDD family protein n=1 Tax=Limimaricola soesokkakensis TaxID=1343159 RepID=UPI00405A371C